MDLNLVQCPFIFTKDMGLIGCRGLCAILPRVRVRAANGCTAKDPSITGILYIVFDDNDIKQLVESDEYSDKYAVVISVKHTSK